MSKKELELKYFTYKGKYSVAKSEIARIEHKQPSLTINTKSINAIAAFDNLFKKN